MPSPTKVKEGIICPAVVLLFALRFTITPFLVCDEGPSLFAELLKLLSVLLILSTMPFSLFFIVKVVQVFFPHSFYMMTLWSSRNMRELSSSGLEDL